MLPLNRMGVSAVSVPSSALPALAMVYFLAAYRVELADVEHTENDDKTDNQWLLTRYYQGTDRLADSDALDTLDTGIAGAPRPGPSPRPRRRRPRGWCR